MRARDSRLLGDGLGEREHRGRAQNVRTGHTYPLCLAYPAALASLLLCRHRRLLFPTVWAEKNVLFGDQREHCCPQRLVRTHLGKAWLDPLLQLSPLAACLPSTPPRPLLSHLSPHPAESSGWNFHQPRRSALRGSVVGEGKRHRFKDSHFFEFNSQTSWSHPAYTPVTPPRAAGTAQQRKLLKTAAGSLGVTTQYEVPRTRNRARADLVAKELGIAHVLVPSTITPEHREQEPRDIQHLRVVAGAGTPNPDYSTSV